LWQGSLFYTGNQLLENFFSVTADTDGYFQLVVQFSSINVDAYNLQSRTEVATA